ncbi:MAG: hypothetical protein IKY10_00475 [Clostridia bacterium]|nr:hypothetical protein [Clostridia bacterium]
MNYIRKLINENKLESLRCWMQKYIPNTQIDFSSMNNFLVMLIKDKDNNIIDRYLVTNYSCKKLELQEFNSTSEISPLKVEGCYFSFMCEHFKTYQMSYIQSLKTEAIEPCTIC